jgi:hypothetical protein
MRELKLSSPNCRGIHAASRIDWNIEIEKQSSISIPKWELGMKGSGCMSSKLADTWQVIGRNSTRENTCGSVKRK